MSPSFLTHISRYGIAYAETSALTSDNVEGALLSLVRDIVHENSSDSGSSGIRKSVDTFMKRASASLDRNAAASNGNGKEEKEKCIVS